MVKCEICKWEDPFDDCLVKYKGIEVCASCEDDLRDDRPIEPEED